MGSRCLETGEHAGMLSEECCIQHGAPRKRPLLQYLQANASGSKSKSETLPTPSQGSPCLGWKYKPSAP